MPSYTYKTPDGEDRVELQMSMATWDEVDGGRGTIIVDDESRSRLPDLPAYLEHGEVLERDLRADIVFRHNGENWPLTSEACGVMPGQRVAAAANAARLGVPTDFDSRGRAIFRTPRHRREYCRRVSGLIDLNGGYSDP